ncbi:MAG: hypothetical protein WD449_01635 [Candidatus Babeliales bacterium]
MKKILVVLMVMVITLVVGHYARAKKSGACAEQKEEVAREVKVTTKKTSCNWIFPWCEPD